MKTSWLLLALCSVAAQPVQGQTSTPTVEPTNLFAEAGMSLGPQLFRPAGGHFSVLTPAPLSASTKADPTPGRNITTTTYRGTKNGQQYGVSLVDMLDAHLEGPGAQIVLDNISASMANSLHGKVTSSKAVTLDGHPGRDIVVAGTSVDDGEVTVKSRIYCVGSRIYQLMVAQPKAKADNAAASAFLDSFKFVDVPAASVTTAQPKAVEFTSADGNFSILTPVPFKESSKEAETPNGKVTTHNYSGYADFVTYMVGYGDDALSSTADPAAALHRRAEAAVAASKGKLISQKDIVLQGLPGVEFVATMTVNNTNATLKGRFYAVGARVYLLQFIAVKITFDETAADAFLNSFKFLSVPAASVPTK